MLNAVIDLSHHNGHPDFRAEPSSMILGVIHKATQGNAMRDPMYEPNKAKAISAGKLWGAYHFGVNGDGGIQAAYFLDVVRPEKDTLLVLDYEPNHSQQTTMTLSQARVFVEHIAEKTGRYPGLYSGSLIKEQLGSKPVDTILSQCWLWVAQYAPMVTNIPPTWKTWSLWQYTDGMHGPQPHAAPGGGFCDRDKFNGDVDGLRRLWGADVHIFKTSSEQPLEGEP